MGFLIIALIVISISLYLLVRRAIEKKQAEGLERPRRERKYSPNQSRTSVAASDSPEVSRLRLLGAFPITPSIHASPADLLTRNKKLLLRVLICRMTIVIWNPPFGASYRDQNKR